MNDPRHFDAQGNLRSAHHEGATAARRKLDRDACPYPLGIHGEGVVRRSWLAGYDQAREIDAVRAAPVSGREFPSYEDGGL